MISVGFVFSYGNSNNNGDEAEVKFDCHIIHFVVYILDNVGCIIPGILHTPGLVKHKTGTFLCQLCCCH